MDEIIELEKVNDYCVGLNLSALHPLVSMLDLSEGDWTIQKKVQAVRYHFYAVFLKQGQQCTLLYGRQNYDYQDGTLVFVGPGQVVNVAHLDTSVKPSGYALLFHPDIMRGTNLGKNMERFSFFSYALHEALHISQRERQIVLECLFLENRDLYIISKPKLISSQPYNGKMVATSSKHLYKLLIK